MTRTKRPWALQASLLAGVTAVLSGGNYVFSLAVAHLLPPGQFAEFSAAQGLLLVLGNGCMAAIPWAMARYIAMSDDEKVKHQALHFGLSASLAQGLAVGVVAGLVLGLTASLAVGVVTGVAAFALSIVAAPVGFLQGDERLTVVAYARVAEWFVRGGVGLVALLVFTRSATSALLGYGVGSMVVVGIGLGACRDGFPLERGGKALERMLLRQSIRLGAVQVFLAMLGALDTVSALASHFAPGVDGGYQVAALLGRVPLFLSTAISLAAYVHLARAPDDRVVQKDLTHALALYVIVTVPCVVVCWTVPATVLGHVFPAEYMDVGSILKYTSVSGAAIGWMNVVSTAHQARARFRPAMAIMGFAACAQPIFLVAAGRTLGITAFTVTLVAISLAGAIALTLDARRWIALRVEPRLVLGFAVLVCALVFASRSGAIWAAVSVGAGAITFFVLRNQVRRGAAEINQHADGRVARGSP